MSLMYRGVSYTSTSQKVETETTRIGIYRGQSYQIRRSVNLMLHPKANLMYRGVLYTMNNEPFYINRIHPSFN